MTMFRPNFRRVPAALIAIALVLPAACVDTAVRRYSSPSGRYTIEIEEWTRTSWASIARTHGASITVLDSSRPLAEHVPVYDGDALDRTFREHYASANWESESDLRLVAPRPEGTDATDLVVIRNSTDRRLAFLFVQTVDAEISVDLRGGTERQILMPAQRIGQGDLSWVAVTGRFEDGSPVALHGENFRLTGREPARVRYLIDVLQTEARIESDDVEKYVFPEDPGRAATRPK